MRKSKNTVYEMIKTIPIDKLMAMDNSQLIFWENEVQEEIDELKEIGRQKTRAYRRALLSLKWLQGIRRIKTSAEYKKTGKMPPKTVIMVVDLSKED